MDSSNKLTKIYEICSNWNKDTPKSDIAYVKAYFQKLIQYQNQILMDCKFIDKNLICTNGNTDLYSLHSFVRIEIYDEKHNFLSRWILSENCLQRETLEIF